MANRVDYLNEMGPTVHLDQMLHLLERGTNSYTKNKIANDNLLKMSFLSDCLSI